MWLAVFMKHEFKLIKRSNLYLNQLLFPLWTQHESLRNSEKDSGKVLIGN